MEFQHNGKRYLISWQHYDDKSEAYVSLPNGGETLRPSVSTILYGLHQLPEDQQRVLGVPHKVGRTVNGRHITYDGVTVCRIRTLKDNAEELPATERWVTVAEAYAFKRSDEKEFDKRAGRRHSLYKAISGHYITDIRGRKHFLPGRFTHETRETIWREFNTIWPPHHPEASRWERKYAKVAQQLRNTEYQIMALERELEKLKTAHQEGRV